MFGGYAKVCKASNARQEAEEKSEEVRATRPFRDETSTECQE